MAVALVPAAIAGGAANAQAAGLPGDSAELRYRICTQPLPSSDLLTRLYRQNPELVQARSYLLKTFSNELNRVRYVIGTRVCGGYDYPR